MNAADNEIANYFDSFTTEVDHDLYRQPKMFMQSGADNADTAAIQAGPSHEKPKERILHTFVDNISDQRYSAYRFKGHWPFDLLPPCRCDTTWPPLASLPPTS